jgi:hypothetical protein
VTKVVKFQISVKEKDNPAQSILKPVLVLHFQNMGAKVTVMAGVFGS